MSSGVTDVTVTWESGGREWQRKARVVKRGRGFVPEQIALLEIAGTDAPRLILPIRLGRSLQPGDKVARYVAPHDTTPGTVVEVDAEREIGGIGTVRFLLVTTRLSGPGDAGAPVVDMEERVVGVVFASSVGGRESMSLMIDYIKTTFPEAF